MRVVTVLGSPRLAGNTATVLDLVEKRLEPGYLVERINIASQEVQGCLGCGRCQGQVHEPGCVQKDDVPGFIQKIMQAHAVLYATPLYLGSYAGQLKLFMDRLFCLTKYTDPAGPPDSLVAGKIMALLVTCAGPMAENADIIQTLFARFSDMLQACSAGSFVVPGCTAPDQLPDSAAVIAQEMALAVTRA